MSVADAPKARNSSRKKSHTQLEPLLAEYGDRWRAKYPAIDVEDEARTAWDHVARTKYTDMPRYVGGWLKRAQERAEKFGPRQTQADDWWESTQRGLAEVGHG